MKAHAHPPSDAAPHQVPHFRSLVFLSASLLLLSFLASCQESQEKHPVTRTEQKGPMEAEMYADQEAPVRAYLSRKASPSPAPSVSPPFHTEGYDHIKENGFRTVKDAPLSTFSVDVDTASYSNTRRFLTEGTLPPPDAVRIEELINYFLYDYKAPEGNEPFTIHQELSHAPWDPSHLLVQIALKAREIPNEKIPPRNLVFLLDVSGSMNSPDKLPLLKKGMKFLTEQLGERDRVSVVVYAGSSGLVLPPTSAANKEKIVQSLEKLQAGGSTNGGEGIQLAYAMARKHFLKGGINRVILATDGDFNVGTTDRGSLIRLIEQKRKEGIFLTVLGFGSGNLKDSTMEQLADHGNGNYAYIDTLFEAKKVLVEQAGSTLVPVAKDVKLQVEFNPRHVASYRLIGYENRVMRDEEFNDDTKDAGEMGSGHTVTALYEIVPAGEGTGEGKVDPLKYQEQRELSPEASSDELMTVKIRYKTPEGEKSRLLSHTIRREVIPLEKTSHNFRFASAVAVYGMMLRDSSFKGSSSFQLAARLGRSALGRDPGGYRSEFIRLVHMAETLQKR